MMSSFERSDTAWYLFRNGQQIGPVSDAEMRQMHQARRIAPTDYLWTAELGDWKLASEILPPPPPVRSPPPFPPKAPEANEIVTGPYFAGVRKPNDHLPIRAIPKTTVQETTEATGGSFKFSTVVLLLLGLILPLWPITLPLFWFLAYRSYKKPTRPSVKGVPQHAR